MSKDNRFGNSKEDRLREAQKHQAEKLLHKSSGKESKKPLTSQNRPLTSSQNNIEFLLKTTGIVAFVADCIAIYIFIQQLLAGQDLSAPSDKTISLAIVIILAFVLSLSLIHFSNQDTSRILGIFGMVYAVYGAILLSITSSYSINEQANRIEQLIGYFILSIVIAVFCFVVMIRSEINMKWAAIPYILSSIFHIGAVILAAANRNDIPLLSHLSLILGIGFVSVFLGFSRK